MSVSKLIDSFPSVGGMTATGQITAIKGPSVTATIPFVRIGDLCRITLHNEKELQAQVVAFSGSQVLLAPFDGTRGIHPGAKVETTGKTPVTKISEKYIGLVCDSLGNPISKQVEKNCLTSERDLFAEPPNPLLRTPIDRILDTGVSAIDTICTLGMGQRLGLFAGPGVGKSSLLGMIARNTNADINVIALIGERGREVREFIEENLGAEGLERSIMIVATSDQPAAKRMMAAYTAQAFAEYFRAKGKNVLLMVDSLTRMARAIREVSLSAGEMPVREGYTPSVYSELPKLLERAGNDDKGSITAIYTVLTANDEQNDALGEEVKSILDGHIVLKRELAQRGVRPAIDPLDSVSRLFTSLHDQGYAECVHTVTKALSTLKNGKDALLFGAEPDAELKRALELEPRLLHLLVQPLKERRCPIKMRAELIKLASDLESV